MIQKQFAEKVTGIIKNNPSVIGLAVSGSWLTGELDEFSDLDLILVTKEQISGDKKKMLEYAESFGNLLTGFTGEHVGDPRVLICLFDNPLLHVDIKFLTLDEFSRRVDTPVILNDTEELLQRSLNDSEAKFPYPDYQWIEDRFWIWIHYALMKIMRGEYFEAIDFFGFLRMKVFGPLMHIKNNGFPRGVRKVESQLNSSDLKALKLTLADYNRESLLNAVGSSISLYLDLREKLFENSVIPQERTEKRVREIFESIK